MADSQSFIPNDPPSLPTPDSFLIYPEKNFFSKFSIAQKTTFGFLGLLAVTILPVTLVAIGVQTQTQSRAAVSNLPVCQQDLNCIQSLSAQPAGTTKCLQVTRDTAVPSWCCPVGQVITNGECRLPFCENGLSCVQVIAPQPTGSSKCTNTANNINLWCCPSGQSITGDRCLKSK